MISTLMILENIVRIAMITCTHALRNNCYLEMSARSIVCALIVLSTARCHPENIVRKGENAGNQYFLIFSKMLFSLQKKNSIL